jgi:hypothetical protein
MPLPTADVVSWQGMPADLSDASGRAIRIKDPAGRLLAIGTMPAGLDDLARRASELSIAVSKVLVTDELQGGRMANSIEE